MAARLCQATALAGKAATVWRSQFSASSVRLSAFSARAWRLSALTLVSASASGRALAAAAWVMGDPRAESLLNRLAEARMRDGGRAAVLAERPF